MSFKFSDASNLVDVDGFSQRTGIHPATVRRMCRRGQIPAQYVARRWLIDYDQFKSGFTATPKPSRPRAEKQAKQTRPESIRPQKGPHGKSGVFR